MTARVSIGDERMQIQRSGFAQWLGPSVDVSLRHVVSVGSADPGQVRRWNKGIRLAGIEIPRLLTWGVYRQGGRVTWWDIGRGDGALLVTLRDEKLDAVVLEVRQRGWHVDMHRHLRIRLRRQIEGAGITNRPHQAGLLQRVIRHVRHRDR